MASVTNWVVSLYPMVFPLDGMLSKHIGYKSQAKCTNYVMKKSNSPPVSDCTVVLLEVGRSPSGFLSSVIGFCRCVIF